MSNGDIPGVYSGKGAIKGPEVAGATGQPGAAPPGYPQQGYPQPGYPPQPGYGPGPGAGMPPKTNGLAIAGLILAFLCPLVGLILSGVALSQINASGGTQGGKGMATWGIIVSIIVMVVGVIIQLGMH